MIVKAAPACHPARPCPPRVNSPIDSTFPTRSCAPRNDCLRCRTQSAPCPTRAPRIWSSAPGRCCSDSWPAPCCAGRAPYPRTSGMRAAPCRKPAETGSPREGAPSRTQRPFLGTPASLRAPTDMIKPEPGFPVPSLFTPGLQPPHQAGRSQVGPSPALPCCPPGHSTAFPPRTQR